MVVHEFSNQKAYREFCRYCEKEHPYFRTVSKPFELPIKVHVFDDENEYRVLKRQNESVAGLCN